MKRFATTAIAALAIALAGCGSDITAPSGAVNAEFSVRTVNGSTLPYTFPSSGHTLQSEKLTLFNDGTYSDDEQFTDGTVYVEQGYYVNNNGAITFTNAENGASYSGSLSGSVLTVIIGTLTEVYQED